VEKQVAILYVATKGQLDEHPDEPRQGVRRRASTASGSSSRRSHEARPHEGLDDEITGGLDSAVAAYRMTFLA